MIDMLKIKAEMPEDLKGVSTEDWAAAAVATLTTIVAAIDMPEANLNLEDVGTALAQLVVAAPTDVQVNGTLVLLGLKAQLDDDLRP